MIPALTTIGLVGVPSMGALPAAIARPLDVRLSTPIRQVQRRGDDWILASDSGEIAESFAAVVLAIPAPLALPLAQHSALIGAALAQVSYRSRWVLLVGTHRKILLPAYREFQGSPVERVAAIHKKPGRVTTGAQRWFVEADSVWSERHAHEDPETVADLLLANFSAHARCPIGPVFSSARFWPNALTVNPASTPPGSLSLWDAQAKLGVCGDSVVASQISLVHRSGVDLAQKVARQLQALDTHAAFASRLRSRPRLAMSDSETELVVSSKLD